MSSDALAVISDVHANLEALTKVLEEIGGLEVVCLGDFVDYGANPNEVIDVVRDNGAKAILGNHDQASLTGDVTMFNPLAAISSKWSRKTLTRSNAAYLRDLPKELRVTVGGTEVYFTHGSPDDNLWEYVQPTTHHLLFGHYLDKVGAGAIGLGHTHVPFVWKEEHGTVFNPGSVGQPRDGDWRASFALIRFSDGWLEVEVKRVEYDAEEAAAKIRAAGLPEPFANRLLP